MTIHITTDFLIKVDSEITLFLPTVEEAEELFLLVDRNRTHLRNFLGWLDNSLEVADTRKFIQENLPLWLQLHSLHLSIRHGKDLVGAVGFHQIDFQNQSAFMGYWLDEEYQGKGIMTKSVKTLMNYGFEVLKLHRIQILCAKHNKRSEKIALHLGFEKEGVLKDAIHHYGSFFDAYIYSKIKK
ncbi:MAG: GNAT family N-acetyltransferase [Candidatus Protochlamydia sp.]|nr:GNAT family N-acetyltransferase [Candidatus Protochlamydia sp.]